jgi:hypothetical protein
MCGLRRPFAASSNWKLDSSSTTMSRGVMPDSPSSRDLPMLPPSQGCPCRQPGAAFAASKMSPIMAVVVLLPTVPVMPTIRPGQRSRKRFISLDQGMPRRTAAWKNGAFRLSTAGLTTSRSQPSRSASSWRPKR